MLEIVWNESLVGYSVPEEGRNPPLPEPPEPLGMERMKQKASTAAIGSILNAGQEAKTEILDYTSSGAARYAGLSRKHTKKAETKHPQPIATQIQTEVNEEGKEK
jgi:hypothetical protein